MKCPICSDHTLRSEIDTVCPLCGAPGIKHELNSLAIRWIEEYFDRTEDLRVFGTPLPWTIQ